MGQDILIILQAYWKQILAVVLLLVVMMFFVSSGTGVRSSTSGGASGFQSQEVASAIPTAAVAAGAFSGAVASTAATQPTTTPTAESGSAVIDTTAGEDPTHFTARWDIALYDQPNMNRVQVDTCKYKEAAVVDGHFGQSMYVHVSCGGRAFWWAHVYDIAVKDYIGKDFGN